MSQTSQALPPPPSPPKITKAPETTNNVVLLPTSFVFEEARGLLGNNEELKFSNTSWSETPVDGKPIKFTLLKCKMKLRLQTSVDCSCTIYMEPSTKRSKMSFTLGSGVKKPKICATTVNCVAKTPLEVQLWPRQTTTKTGYCRLWINTHDTQGKIINVTGSEPFKILTRAEPDSNLKVFEY